MLLSLGRGMAPAPAPPSVILGDGWLFAENGWPLATQNGHQLALNGMTADPPALSAENGWSLISETGQALLFDTRPALTAQDDSPLTAENDLPLILE